MINGRRQKMMRAPQRFIIDKEALESFYDNTNMLGKSYLFVCSNSALKACKARIEKGFEGKDCTLRFETFAGQCTTGEIARFKKIIEDDKIEVVVGAGGGSAIDTAKCAAFEAGHKPVVTIPTVVATDAPCTGLAVVYNDDHSFNSYVFFARDPEVVVCDSVVICNSPVRQLVSGMGDAMATYFEMRSCAKNDSPTLIGESITLSSMALCDLCYKTLLEDGFKAKVACELGALIPAVEHIIEANVYLSGVGADNAGLAIAHSIYNGFTVLEEETARHGELCAFGSLVQLIVESAPTVELYEAMDFCIKVGLPVTLAEFGVDNTKYDRILMACEAACAPGETCHNTVGGVTPKLLADACLVVDKLGALRKAELAK